MKHDWDADRQVPVTARSHISTVFQPIRDLQSLSVVAYEALSRWPEEKSANPGTIFARAADDGTVDALDWRCRLTAIKNALQLGLTRDVFLFLNGEAAVRFDRSPPWGAELLAASDKKLQIVLELTERSLLRRPAGILRQVAEARDRGWLIALDDVGVDEDSLSLLDIVAPDVIKLDMTLIQNSLESASARALAAVKAHVERFGSSVVAEGIETDEHLERAIALGADLGQGWLLGRPQPGFTEAFGKGAHVLSNSIQFEVPKTPFEMVADTGLARCARKEFLLAFSHHIEAQAVNDADPPIVLTAMQDAKNLTLGTRQRYKSLASAGSIVAIFGQGIDASHEIPGVRLVPLESNDALRLEWTVVALGAQTAAALIGRDKGDCTSDLDRRFDFVITYDRQLVAKAARSIFLRLAI
ncbi:sensor domain-containing phosphodiesterase [Nakamurella alba]|nr:EAL domain-containing protein [Nakamurella alba]